LIFNQCPAPLGGKVERGYDPETALMALAVAGGWPERRLVDHVFSWSVLGVES